MGTLHKVLEQEARKQKSHTHPTRLQHTLLQLLLKVPVSAEWPTVHGRLGPLELHIGCRA